MDLEKNIIGSILYNDINSYALLEIIICRFIAENLCKGLDVDSLYLMKIDCYNQLLSKLIIIIIV